MKKILLNSLFLCLVAVGFSQEGSLADFALIFSHAEEKSAIGSLPLGVPVHVMSMAGEWTQIESGGFRGWTKSPVFLPPQGWKITQANELLLCPKILLDDNVPIALWVYKNQLWWYDIEGRKVIKKENFGSISGIMGLYRNRWLLVYRSYSEPEQPKPSTILEIGLYDLHTKRRTFLGFYDGKSLGFEDFVVSPTSKYALLTVRTKKISVTHIIHLQVFQWLGWVTNISQPRWLGEEIILFRSQGQLFRSSLSDWTNGKGRVEASSFPLPKGVAKLSSYRIENTNLYILAEKKVYKSSFDGSNWQLTGFRSLEWNSEQTLNIYADDTGGHLYDLRQKRTLKPFSGENPEKEFIAFTLDGLIVQQNFAKIPTLFLLDNDLKEMYRYKAIDKIHAMDIIGNVIEVIEEGGELLLIVERPRKGYYFVFPRKM